MKRNHIAIAGILASVLVTMDAAWADTGTVIASQAYVDAKVGTKLNSSALNAGTLSTTSTTTVPSEKTVNDAITSAVSNIDVSAPAATTYVTNGTNALSLSDSTDHAPSITAVKGMKTTSVRTSGAVDTLVPTEKAVATALSDKLNSDLVNDDANAIVDDHAERIPTNNAVQKGVLYMKGDGIARRSTAADLDTITAAQSWTNAAGDDNSIRTILEGRLMDNYVPTMAAVEARVKAAEGLIPTVPGGTNTKSATYSSSAHTLTVATSGDGASTSKYATPKQVANTITDVKKYIDYKDGLKVDANTAITASGTTNKIVQYDAKGLVVAGTTAGALATKDAVGSADITDLSITNADISNSAAIAYTKMNGTLKDVNSASTDATCTAASPCVLTYYKIGSNVYYKWTNLIETDGVTALPAS